MRSNPFDHDLFLNKIWHHSGAHAEDFRVFVGFKSAKKSIKARFLTYKTLNIE